MTHHQTDEPTSRSYPKTACELPDYGNLNDKIIRTGSRRHGATQNQFKEFVRAADAGLRVEMNGQNYVAMSRNMYEELTSKPKDKITGFYSETSVFTDEQLEVIQRSSPLVQPIPESSPRPTPNPTQPVERRGRA